MVCIVFNIIWIFGVVRDSFEWIKNWIGVVNVDVRIIYYVCFRIFYI